MQGWGTSDFTTVSPCTFITSILCVEAESIDSERQALQWVQEYIDDFGGDPERVTLCVSLSLTHHTNCCLHFL